MLAFIDGLLVVIHQIFITGNQAKLKNEQGLTGSPGRVESSTTLSRVTDKPHAISVQLSVIPWAMSRLWYRRSCIVSTTVLQYPPLWNVYGPI